MPTTSLLTLALIVFVAFSVESALGFGATVVAVALAANIVPIAELLPAFVPLNMVLSASLAVRDRRAIDLRTLFRGVLPPMALGLPVGLYALGSFDPVKLRVAFGIFVLVLSALEIARSVRTPPAEVPTETRATAGRRAFDLALLFLGGVIHGAFATGGPMAVYVTGKRLGSDRRVFRATLAALWLLLNTALIATFIVQRKFGAASTRTSLALVPSLVLGMALGTWAHDRIPAKAFRLGIFVLLAVAATVLVARA